MSLFQYNGITLPYGATTSFQQEAMREDSDTDWFLTKYTIEITCPITPDYLGAIAPSLGGQTSSPASIVVAIRNRLMTHRKRINFSFNGTSLIPNNNLTGQVDADNGPKPQYCNIVDMTNQTYLMSYKIIANYWEKTGNSLSLEPPNNTTNNPVLYNRWTESVDIDILGMSTRTREGRFVIRSDNSQGITPDSLRSQMAVTSVPAGFLRESSSYKISKDGLGLEYRLTDREQFKMPPSPAYTASGKYSESTAMRGGARRLCECQITLKGAKNVPQGLLLSTAVNVATSKLLVNGAGVNQPETVLEYAIVTADMYNNEVDVTIRTSANPRTTTNGKGRLQGVAGVRFVDFTYTPLSDSPLTLTTRQTIPEPTNLPPLYKDRGTANIFLQAAAYYDPGLTGTILNKATGQMSRGLVPGQAGDKDEED